MADPPADVDWLRIVHRGATLLRSIRGDREVDEDHATERGRAATLKETLNDVARHAVGCKKPAACDCPICREE